MRKTNVWKSVMTQYRKTIMQAVINACTCAFTISWFPALYKIKSLEIGEYPEEPAEIVYARLQEMKPIIIRNAVICFVLLLIVFLVVFLIYWFKRSHGINLIKELWNRLFKQKSSS